MAVGGRRLVAGAPTGPGGAPRLVPVGASPWAAPDQQRLTELRFLAIERIAPAQSAVVAAGEVVATFQVPSDRVWSIERITVSSKSTTVTGATVYIGSVDPANMADLTPAGNGDVADEVNPIIVPAGSSLIVVWTGVSATDANGAPTTASVRCQGEAGAITQVPIA